MKQVGLSSSLYRLLSVNLEIKIYTITNLLNFITLGSSRIIRANKLLFLCPKSIKLNPKHLADRTHEVLMKLDAHKKKIQRKST